MKLIPTLFTTLSLLVSPVLLAEPHDTHQGETAEEHANHTHDKHDHAGHDHAHDNKPHHGGVVAVSDGFHHELVAADGKLALYAEGLPKGEELKAVKVRLTLLQGVNKRDINLSHSQDDSHRFEATSDAKLNSGDKVVVLIRPAKGKPRLVKFEIPNQ